MHLVYNFLDLPYKTIRTKIGVRQQYPLNEQIGYPRCRSSLYVEQPMSKICVRLAPLPQIFRLPAFYCPPSPPGIFPLHLQDSPHGVPSLYALSFESKICVQERARGTRGAIATLAAPQKGTML